MAPRAPPPRSPALFCSGLVLVAFRCVDVTLLPAVGGVSPPPSPPALLVSNVGSYDFDAANAVDTSASTFACCALRAGSLDVPAYAPYATSFVASLSGVRAERCRESSDVSAPPTAALTYDGVSVTFTLVRESAYTASASFGGQVQARKEESNESQ